MRTDVTDEASTATKAAPVVLTTHDAKGLPDVRVGAVDPGCTATDLNGGSGPQTVTQGTEGINAVVRLATEGPGHGSGRSIDRDGEIGWS